MACEPALDKSLNAQPIQEKIKYFINICVHLITPEGHVIRSRITLTLNKMEYNVFFF